MSFEAYVGIGAVTFVGLVVLGIIIWKFPAAEARLLPKAMETTSTALSR